MKRLLVSAVLLCLAAMPLHAVELDDCANDVLPDGSKRCAFRHIAYQTFSYSNGELSLSWPESYELQDAYLVKNWKKMFEYEPGSRVQVEFASNARYDVVARFTDRNTGETSLGITPVSCVTRVAGQRGLTLTPAPAGGCVQGSLPRSCSVRTDVDCVDSRGNPDGQVAVECSGDTGTCSDECSDSETACCSATRTSTQTSSNGTQSSVTTIEQQSQSCND